MVSESFMLGELTIEVDAGIPVIHGPAGEGADIEVRPCEAELRAWVREDDSGRYRPLPSARTMRHGWRLRCTDSLPLGLALDVIYPLAQRHREMFDAGTLRVVSEDEVFGRQTGRYRAAGRLSDAGRKIARDALCGRCVKTPLWSGLDVPPGGIPCPEACSVMLSLCREAALWEDHPPTASAPDGTVPWAAFDETGNEIREDYLQLRFSSEANRR